MTGTTLTIADCLKFADLQMAAEAFLVNKGNGRVTDDVQQALVNGNFHASRFTEVQARALEKHWIVLDQQANTTTGFSGTLFRNKDTNELVMSFRSTEFIDDAARDNQATNALEIAATGYAWGQIRDMEAWYQGLEDRGLLPPGQTFAVTGYSLGGHLATVFNLLHGPNAPKADQAGISQIVTFNGAGVGGFDTSIGLKQLVQQFSNASTGSPKFAEDALAQIYVRAKTALAAEQQVGNSDLTALRALANPPPDSGMAVDTQTKKQAQMVLDAIARVGVIRGEVERLAHIGSGDGDDYINSANLTVAARWKPQDIWLALAGKEIETQEAHRGIYLERGLDGDIVNVIGGCRASSACNFRRLARSRAVVVHPSNRRHAK